MAGSIPHAGEHRLTAAFWVAVSGSSRDGVTLPPACSRPSPVSEHALEFLVREHEPSGESADEVLARLGLAVGRTTATDILFMDTFDGRLHRRGKVFQVERSPGGRIDLVLRDFCGRKFELRSKAVAAPVPRFADQVADQPLRQELQLLLDVRALLPVVKVRRLRQDLKAVDDNEIVPANLYLDRFRVLGRSKPVCPVAARLVVEARESDDKGTRRAAENWAQRLPLPPAEHDLWCELLSLVDQPAGPGFTVAPPDLSSEMRADLATKRMLLAQLEAMRAQEPGMLANVDSEFLHDFRVAVRRSRTVLGQLRGLFPERAIGGFRRDLSWLGTMTGPARDLDVYLLHFPQLEAAVPEFMRGDLAPLRALLEQRAMAARKGLVRSLNSPRYRKFTQRWDGFLRKPVPQQPTAPKALEPIRTLASKRIWKLYRRVISDGRSMGDQASAEAIHELRKRCKKIRYLTEFVAPLHPREALKKPIKDLKALQSQLGSLQDAEVQIAHLREWSAELASDPAVPAATLLAVGALIGSIDQCQRQRRAGIAGAVEEFGHKENRERFRRLPDERG